MNKLKKGDIVSIKNNKDNLIYSIIDIIKEKDGLVTILKGITLRIETCATTDELELVDKDKINLILNNFENSINTRAEAIIENHSKYDFLNRNNLKKGGIILHLDGDKKYASQSSKVYSKFGLNAIVKNIKENRQPSEVVDLLNKYNPDILVITGHDGMIKKGINYNDLNNYRNSKYFVDTVRFARKWEQGANKLSIFAGACQSYYEAIIESGANFASSPARILIDFMDPLVIARKIAITPDIKFLTIKEIRDEIRNGERGISGIGSYGKLI